jgi:hypothetical protein
MRKGPGSPEYLPLGLVAILALAAGGILVYEARSEGAGADKAREFQTLVGGLGFGPALELSTCPNSFDPRLCAACPRNVEPIPGGQIFCPQHAGSIFYYPRLDAVEPPPGDGHARRR